MVIRAQDLKVLFRAQEVIGQLVAEGLAVVPSMEPAIAMARETLEHRQGRRVPGIHRPRAGITASDADVLVAAEEVRLAARIQRRVDAHCDLRSLRAVVPQSPLGAYACQ